MTTIKDIARRAGVSIGTVDRVIHRRGRVSDSTRRIVEKAIHDLDYRPNIFARQLKLSKTVTFGILMPAPEQDSGYWQLPAAGIRKARNELACHQVDIRFFTFDRYRPASFKQAFRRMLADGLDGLLIAPVFTSLARELIETIPGETPFVFFDSTIPGTRCVSCTIQDSFQSGLLSARLLHLLSRGSGTLAAVRMARDDFHINERIKGFRHFFRGSAEERFIVVEPESSCKADVDTLVRTLLNNTRGLSGLFITNALTFRFARSLQAAALPHRVPVVGYDLIKKNIACLRQGGIDFLISQQSDNQGYQGLYALFRQVVLNESVEKEIFMPIEIITKENIDYYQQQWSGHA